MGEENVIAHAPKEFTERDNKAPSIPLTRKKQVTFTDTCSTSTNNTQKHRVHQKVQQSNVQVIPSTGVSGSTRACGSKPRNNTKNNRILPAKSVNNKKGKMTILEQIRQFGTKESQFGNQSEQTVSDNSLEQDQATWKRKGNSSDNSVEKDKQVWKQKANSQIKVEKCPSGYGESNRHTIMLMLVNKGDPQKRNSP
ncbi:hypothetical protein Tco_1327378 [Tanacetum coccineum]